MKNALIVDVLVTNLGNATRDRISPLLLYATLVVALVILVSTIFLLLRLVQQSAQL